MIPSEIKMHMAQEIGTRLDDMLDGAKREVAIYEGSKQALGLAHSKVSDHLKYIDKDLEEGKLDLEQSVLVKRYIGQVLGILQNLCTGADVQKLQAQGKVLAFESSVKTTKSAFDIEKARVAMSKPAEGIAGESAALSLIRERATGEHPGDPLAARRNEEVADVPVVPKRVGKPRKAKKA